MKDKGKKLTEKELKRKAHFEVLRAETAAILEAVES